MGGTARQNGGLNTAPVIIQPQIKIDSHPRFHSQLDHPDSRQWSFLQNMPDLKSHIDQGKFVQLKHVKMLAVFYKLKDSVNHISLILSTLGCYVKTLSTKK